jgi:hypothetical protein
MYVAGSRMLRKEAKYYTFLDQEDWSLDEYIHKNTYSDDEN